MRVFKTVKRLPMRMICLRSTLLVLLLIGLPMVGWAVDFQACRSCHQGELEQAEIRLIQHEPFMQQQCAACHAVVATETSLQLSTAKADTQEPAQKVTWLADSSQLSREHGFTLPADKLGDRLVVDLRGEQTRYPRQVIDLPLLKELKEATPNKAAPKISAPKVLEVKRGVFLSVLIGWRTDVLTDAKVLYGIQDLAQNSDLSQRLGRSHQVRLYNLKPDQKYQYQVVSTDLFGRTTVSETHHFSTHKPFNREKVIKEQTNKINLQTDIQRMDSDYVIQLTSDEPAAVFVGSSGDLRVQQAASGLPELMSVPEMAHDGLSSGVDLGIIACRNCHRNKQQATHPVNVLPRPGMTIPQEYPTLPDGRISCASCHLTHSSDNEYLAIRRGKRELCVGCHKDML